MAKAQLHLFGSAQIDIFPDDFLKEAASADGSIPDLGERKLRLQDRQLVAVTGSAAFGPKGMRQPAQPFAKKGLDLLLVEVIAEPLGDPHILTPR